MSLRKKIFFILLLVLLAFLSFIPRSVEVINGNFIFLLDQGRDYLAVRDVVESRKLTLIGSEVGGGMAGIQGVFHGPFYFYLLSIPFLLFSGDPYGGVVMMFFFGIATIVMAFIFAKKVFDNTIAGLITALLVAVSPPLIAQSRFIWNPHPSSFFILLTFYFIYLLFEKKKKYFFLAAFFAGFIYNFDTAIALPLSIALLLYAIWMLKGEKLGYYLSLIAGFLIAYSPFLFFQFRHGFTAVTGVVNYLFYPQNKTSSFLNNHFDAFLINFFDTFPKQSFLPPVLILILFVSLLYFFLIKEKNIRIKYFLLFLTLLTALTFFILSFLRSHVFPYYLIHVNFAYIFFFSYIFFSSFRKRIRNIQLIFVVLLLNFLAFAVIHAGETLRKDLSDYGGMAKIKGKIDALKYIYDDAKGERFGLLIFSPPVYTYPYDYLIWWYGRKQFGYIPHQEKRGLFYLLIEKDHSQPWTYKGWLETVIKSGKVLETKELPSGFIVQKRLAT